MRKLRQKIAINETRYSYKHCKSCRVKLFPFNHNNDIWHNEDYVCCKLL